MEYSIVFLCADAIFLLMIIKILYSSAKDTTKNLVTDAPVNLPENYEEENSENDSGSDEDSESGNLSDYEDFSVFPDDRHYRGEFMLAINQGTIMSRYPCGYERPVRTVLFSKPAIGPVSHISFCHRDIAIVREDEGQYYWMVDDELFLFTKGKFPLGFIRNYLIVADPAKERIVMYMIQPTDDGEYYIEYGGEKKETWWISDQQTPFTHSVNLFSLANEHPKHALMLLNFAEGKIGSATMLTIDDNGLSRHSISTEYARAVLQNNSAGSDISQNFRKPEDISEFPNFMELQQKV